MTRFLLTADWQIGLKASFAGERSEKLREVRFQTVERIVRLAQSEAVDFVILAGDTFDQEWLPDEMVDRVLKFLESTEMPVYVLPGNHDPHRAGSLWERTAWQKRPEGVIFLDQEAPVQAPGCTLFPCPLRQKKSGSNPTTWIPKRGPSEGIRVGVAHGALDTLGKPMNFPIPPNAPEVLELDFLCLGDWHGLKVSERWAYPGTPEPCRFDEVQPGHVVIVQIDAPHSAPKVVVHKVSTLDWLVIEGIADSPQAVDDLLPSQSKDASNRCYRVQISPTTKEAASALSQAIESLSQRAFWVDSPHAASHQEEEIDLPPGLISQVDALLADSEAARSELRRILREVKR